MKLGKLKIDCTPPPGTLIGLGIGGKTLGVRDPLWLRGVILDDGNKKWNPEILSRIQVCVRGSALMAAFMAVKQYK